MALEDLKSPLFIERRHLASLLDISLPTLTYIAYGRGKKYKSFTIPKRGGGVREIKAPVDVLKSIQRKLLMLLEEVYPSPSYVYGFIEGKSIVGNASTHVGMRTVLNFDLEDFFPSINAGRVMGLFKAEPFYADKEVASILTGLVCYENSLPQGAPTSPIISNMIAYKFDKAMFKLARKKRFNYTRYADDITLSTRHRKFPEDILTKDDDGNLVLGESLMDLLEENGFQVNKSKTRLGCGSQSKYVTGVKVNTKPNLSRSFMREVRAMVHALGKFGVDQAQEHFDREYHSGGRKFMAVLEGKLAHIKNVKGESDLQYRKLYNAFAREEGLGRPELPENEIQELYDKVFVVRSGTKQGTGFILNQNYLVTCEHVLEQDDVQYYTHNNFPLTSRSNARANRAWTSADYDVAFISPQHRDRNARNSLSIAAENEIVEVGDSYRVLGFPNYLDGSQPHIVRVQVTNVSRDKYGVLNAYVDRKMISGQSGSPVINDRNEVVGIAVRGTSTRATGDDLTGYVFIPINEIRKFVSSVGDTALSL